VASADFQNRTFPTTITPTTPPHSKNRYLRQCRRPRRGRSVSPAHLEGAAPSAPFRPRLCLRTTRAIPPAPPRPHQSLRAFPPLGRPLRARLASHCRAASRGRASPPIVGPPLAGAPRREAAKFEVQRAQSKTGKSNTPKSAAFPARHRNQRSAISHSVHSVQSVVPRFELRSFDHRVHGMHGVIRLVSPT
jgi:hypothetical protein